MHGDWISVRERMPVPGLTYPPIRQYLAWVRGRGVVAVKFYIFARRFPTWTDGTLEVQPTHWMPDPEEPKAIR